MRLRLKPEYKELSEQYNEMLQTGGCSCHINAPCGVCTHEGHPISLEENDDAWITVLNITSEEIKQKLTYDPITGKFTHKEVRCNPRLVGTEAGSISPSGYRNILINKRKYKSSRLAWIYMYGSIPYGLLIDHINGNKSDDRIENLRLANHSTNGFNVGLRKNNSTGYTGVYKENNRFRADATVKGVKYYLGTKDTPEEAYELYKSFVKEHHGQHIHESLKD